MKDDIGQSNTTALIEASMILSCDKKDPPDLFPQKPWTSPFFFVIFVPANPAHFYETCRPSIEFWVQKNKQHSYQLKQNRTLLGQNTDDSKSSGTIHIHQSPGQQLVGLILTTTPSETETTAECWQRNTLQMH